MAAPPALFLPLETQKSVSNTCDKGKGREKPKNKRENGPKTKGNVLGVRRQLLLFMADYFTL